MNSAREWQHLKRQLRDRDYSSEMFKNQYFRRLLRVLQDGTAADQLLAYRDALLGAGNLHAEDLPSKFIPADIAGLLENFGLGVKRSGGVFLEKKRIINDIDLDPVYGLEKRRFIHTEMIDPALQTRLKDANYKRYNGKAQQLAVRLAITGRRNSTLIVNLPTGCGKTLVAHAASLYASDNQLTLVIMPTIGLAIEQGERAKDLLKKAGLHHGGIYYWHGGQTQEQHKDIKTRIKDQRQRLLFCSPEAACRSLLPTLFTAASENMINSIVIDEAHIVDQWGTEFRPYFQIIASLTRSLRKVSADGIKCILMSGTFTEKSLNLVRELFGIEGEECIQVNGCFLRPEIQYSVNKVSKSDHLKHVLNAVIALPKPMIIYTLYPDDATRIYSAIQQMGLNRSGLFTGKTSTDKREDLVRSWSKQEIDIMVATSAFGLGMDKDDVRSVVHATVPENLDRFYQEVGRGGRDGLASQSLLIYFEEQVSQAERLNNIRLITVELGLEKWRTMWEKGGILPGGRRRVHISSIRNDQQDLTDGNEEWNWRTLLLMQRAGLIKIELEKPLPPSIDPNVALEDYRKKMSVFYDNYYDNVTITPLRDDHLDEIVWDKQTQQRRSYEKYEQKRGHQDLLRWLRNYHCLALCDLLLEYYTLEQRQPEYACGGCPKCLGSRDHIESPTVGKSVYASGVYPETSWRAPLQAMDMHQYVYYPNDGLTQKRLLRKWVNWIARLIDVGAVRAVCADPGILKNLDSELRNVTSVFWIGDALDEELDDYSLWPKLVLHLDGENTIPKLGWKESTVILMAPEELGDKFNDQRKWWESINGSVSLNNFLFGLDYGNNQ